MSGFVAVLVPDGGAVAPSLMAALAAHLEYRAPDGTESCVAPGVGMGHAHVRGTRSAPVADRQPNSITDRFWIAAEARIDNRSALLERLETQGNPCARNASDATLLLAAHASWGESCADHLLGDFSFIIWDREQRTGFAARDHFGVKPFYYSRVKGNVVVSNTIEAIRAFPGVSAELDDTTIADLLVYGWKLDLSRTAFAEIHALPPAHSARIGTDGVAISRYWAAPTDEVLRYPRVRDYADHFDALFTEAIGDRVGPGATTVLMSGGRDSTAIAATARRITQARPEGSSLRAVTAVYDHDMPDDERRFAGIAAKALGIPIDFLPVDGYRILDGVRARALRAPEPILEAMPAIHADLFRLAGQTGPVVLDGTGGDGVMRESESRLAHLLAARRYVTAAREAVEYIRWHRRLPRPGFRSLRRRARLFGRHELAPPPSWLSADLARRVGTQERWHDLVTSKSPHPNRPEAHWLMTSPFWTALLETQDAGATGIALELRYPFLDVRLVRFLLSVPPAQWYNDKGLLRIVMRGRLPDAIVDRNKAPLAGDPVDVRMRKAGHDWLRGATISPIIDRYVDRSRVPTLFGGTSTETWGGSAATLYPLLLGQWMEAL